MNKYLKEFFHRGLMFGGFGPIIMGIIYCVLSYKVNDFSLDGREVFVAVLSTYLLAFVHAGSSIFNQIEHWSVMKGLLCQLLSLYIVYIGCYLINSWIPVELSVILIFTAIFVAAYLIVWGIIYLMVKNTGRKLSEKLR